MDADRRLFFSQAAAAIAGPALPAMAEQPKANQDKEPARPFRVALVNFHEVIKNYKGLDIVRAKSKEMFEKYENELKELKRQHDEAAKKLKDDPSADEREKLEREMTRIRIEMEETTKKGQKAIMLFEQDSLASIYREVRDLTADYAKRHGFDMVIRFNEDWGKEYDLASSVVDRLKHPMWPMFWDPKIDITEPIRKAFADRLPA